MALDAVPYRVRALPIVGPWASRIGRVVDIWGMPCNTTPEVWALAAWHTVPTMLLALVKPSPIEYANQRFGRSHRRRRPTLALKGVTTIVGSTVPIPQNYAWAKFVLSQGLRAFQYVQFIDVGTRGLLQWSSMVYSWSGCQVPGAGGGYQTSIGDTVFLGSLSGSPLTLPTDVTYQQNCVGAAFVWACSASQQWSASYSVGWEPIDGFPPPNPQFELIDQTTNQPVGSDFGPGRTATGFFNQGFYRHASAVASPTNFAIRYRSDHAFRVTQASFSVSGSANRDFMRPDP